MNADEILDRLFGPDDGRPPQPLKQPTVASHRWRPAPRPHDEAIDMERLAEVGRRHPENRADRSA